MERKIYQLMRDVEDTHWWFTARREIVSKLLGSLSLSPEMKILDVGCGTGGNFNMLSKFGQLEGLECDEEALLMARKRDVCPVLHGSMPECVSIEGERYHLITMFDVLEHIEDDRGTILKAWELLLPGGRLMLTVPAFPFLWSEHDTQHHHKRRYKRGQLEQLLIDAKFEPEYLTYYNTLLFPIVVAARLIKRVAGIHGDEEELPPPLLNRALKQIMASERHLMPGIRLPFGVSLLAVCRKPLL
ncbi:2-polyprenyl-3-methyl-5-hydroxy-6-metoxy-1,4-benzoquinol methylase [Mariprofundus ferrinatatus]|uniref:2-polyprenyl-3-methyl-5-hydroxy-6-metoxy-1, 4-benzoquinol methylase n=1 Tax=Mariprofundus ferrinatatus TaxID=1921087 RepID=A0A2K8L3V0_9PROT|nr:class I SAM-dependent methyltransferase [Mariprofundus ferrinatatus]ATX81782.1 2-polyprenyl-3-methyl-5-hydroxy-6-metoxy-1,4-benzoquinol methylase [Mariprofundus ferrinatatus]